MRKLLISGLLLVLPLLLSASLAETRGKTSYLEGTPQEIYLDDISFLKEQEKTATEHVPSIYRLDSEDLQVIRAQNIQSFDLPGREMSDEPVSLVEICRGSLRRSGTLEERLEGCGWLTEQIIWETGSGERIQYPDWPVEKKDRLNELFDRIMRNERDLGIRCRDPGTYLRNGEIWTNRFLTEVQAFDIYAAHVAHVFYLEVTRQVPWSILNRPPVELKELLASERYHARIVAPQNQWSISFGDFRPYQDFQLLPERFLDVSTICDPRVGYLFLRGENSSGSLDLLGTTEEETLKNLSLWVARNFIHPNGDVPLPIPSTLQERLSVVAIDREDIRAIVATAGCHTVASTLVDLARSINIPLMSVTYTTLNPHELAQIQFRGSGGFPHFFRLPTHKGLVYNWGTNPRIIRHTDDLYERRNFPGFLLESDGRRMTSQRELAQRFFDTLWVVPNTLESWGLQHFRNYPQVQSGIDFGIYNQRGAYFHENFGPFLGFFRRSGIGEGNTTSSRLQSRYEYEQKYQLCSWGLFIEWYCNLSEADFLSRIRGNIEFESVFSLPVVRTAGDFYNRAAACVTAYGGCSEARGVHQEWLLRLGSNGWRN